MLSTTKTGSIAWMNFKEIESQVTNQWITFDKATSGQNAVCALENVWRNVWAFRKKTAIKKKNKTATKDIEITIPVTADEAPKATNENWPLETVAYKKHCYHHLLHPKASSGTAVVTRDNNEPENRIALLTTTNGVHGPSLVP